MILTIDHALEYAKRGMAVFPIISGMKKPLKDISLYMATTDQEQIKAWWSKYPDANIGYYAGNSIGDGKYIVLDIDKKEGRNGFDTLRILEKKYGTLDDTPCQNTPNNGSQFFFKWADGIKGKNDLAEGIDIRASTYYCLLPPSRLEESTTGNPYEWEWQLDEIKPAELSPEWIEYLRTETNKQETNDSDTPPSKTLQELYAPIRDGQRHDRFLSIIGHLKGRLSDQEIEIILRMVNETITETPETESEIEDDIVRAIYKGLKNTSPDFLDELPEGFNSLDFENDPEPLKALSLNNFEEKTVDWLIDGYIPKRCITIMGAEGGAGKTSVWCNIAAAISAGQYSLFDRDKKEQYGYNPPDPQKVLFFSSEDAVEEVLLKRLKAAGANINNIVTVPLSNEHFSEIRYNSEQLKNLIEQTRPALVIFDPLQSYVSPKCKMAERGAMRNELNPLIGLCEMYDTTALIIMHANKQAGVWGRKRLADSADIWDIARSVLMLGETGEGDTRYISHEKCNYARTSETVLFDVTEGYAKFAGYSGKKDKDYVCQVTYEREAPKRDTTKELIIELLQDEPLQEKDLKAGVKANGATDATYRAAKEELKKDGVIKVVPKGFGKDKKWLVMLTETDAPEIPFTC